MPGQFVFLEFAQWFSISRLNVTSLHPGGWFVTRALAEWRRKRAFHFPARNRIGEASSLKGCVAQRGIHSQGKKVFPLPTLVSSSAELPTIIFSLARFSPSLFSFSPLLRFVVVSCRVFFSSTPADCVRKVYLSPSLTQSRQ
jgi:hypothetical protein